MLSPLITGNTYFFALLDELTPLVSCLGAHVHSARGADYK